MSDPPSTCFPTWFPCIQSNKRPVIGPKKSCAECNGSDNTPLATEPAFEEVANQLPHALSMCVRRGWSARDASGTHDCVTGDIKEQISSLSVSISLLTQGNKGKVLLSGFFFINLFRWRSFFLSAFSLSRWFLNRSCSRQAEEGWVLLGFLVIKFIFREAVVHHRRI
jgi:hypothetical protein